MTDEYDYHRNKKPDKTYISRSIEVSSLTDQPPRRIRIASKVIDSPETHEFVREKGELVIRVTGGGRQEVVAKVYEDTRGVSVLTIQRFTVDTGSPHKTHFSFRGDEITRLIEFISNLRLVQFRDDSTVNVSDSELRRMLLSPEQVRNLVIQNVDLVLDIARSDITHSDIMALGYRKHQLEEFEKLLSDRDHFEGRMRSLNMNDEAVWQQFFEKNTWVFGYGLTYLWLSNLDEKKLEQVVAGHTFMGKGKRSDAILKTGGAINALCFVEIKKHTTKLLKNADYRPGCWSPSDELAGGIVQVQVTVEKSVRSLQERLEPVDKLGDPTGEQIFTYHPRSFLVVGKLSEFKTENGVNNDKYRSFELFRRSIDRPEIITFDELYERARFIVAHAEM
jgi:hypothetical protein